MNDNNEEEQQYDTPWELKSRAIVAALGHNVSQAPALSSSAGSKSGGRAVVRPLHGSNSTSVIPSGRNKATVSANGGRPSHPPRSAAQCRKESVEHERGTRAKAHSGMSSSRSSSIIATVNGSAYRERSSTRLSNCQEDDITQCCTTSSYLPARPAVKAARHQSSGAQHTLEQGFKARGEENGTRHGVGSKAGMSCHEYPLLVQHGQNTKIPHLRELSSSLAPIGTPTLAAHVDDYARRKDPRIHDGIERVESELLLNQREVGDFLLRRKSDGSLALSLRASQGVLHIRLESRRSEHGMPYWVLGEGPKFATINGMLRCYRKIELPVRGAEHIRLKSLL